MKGENWCRKVAEQDDNVSYGMNQDGIWETSKHYEHQ